MIVETDTETIDLGTTETTPTISIVDYSRRVTDDFGVTTVVPRGYSRRLSVRLALPFDEVDTVQRQLAELRATSAMWIADERFNWLSAEGFYKDFEIDLAVPPISYCTLTVEGIAETETVADGGEDPAPEGSVSTFRLLKPAMIDSAALASSNVTENDYPQWSAGTTYAAGARVILAGTHRIYESLIAGNVGWDPMVAVSQWLDIGPTNRWAMFDQALGTATTRPSPVTVTLNVTDVDAVALLDVTAANVRVQAPGYDQTKAVAAGSVMFLDLPLTTGQVTITASGGTIAIGTLLVGRRLDLGITEASPSAGITDYSRKEVDDFGEVTIVQRAWAKRMSARALIDTDAVDVVANRIAAVRATPSLWIGEAGLDSLTIYGFFKDFSIEVGETVSKLSLSIEGLSEAAPIGPGGVAWTDVRDDDPVAHPKPEDGATVGAPPGTPVGDRPAEDVVSAIDLHTTHLADLDTSVGAAQGDIDSLFATYGDTQSAAQSAADAASSLTTVQGIEDHIDAQKLLVDQALVAAEAAEQGATDQAGFALADRQLAQTARGGAESARDTAILARDTAQGHSATASQQAVLSASSSSASRLAALARYSTRTNSLDDWQNSFGDPRNPLLGGPPENSPSLANDSLLGPVIAQTRLTLCPRAPMPCVEGRKYRVRMSARFPNGTNAIRLLIFPTIADNTRLPNTEVYGNTVSAGGISSVDTIIDCSSILAAQPTAAYVFLYAIPDETANPGSASRTGKVFIEDVTESEKSQEASSAAVIAAATASTKRDEASGFAATASTQAGLAVEAKNDAQTAAGVSTTQAAIATDKAAASQTIFENVASLRSNALHKNAGFDDYPSAAVGAIPTGWGVDPVNVGSGYRVPGPTGGYSWRLSAAAFTEVYGRAYSEFGAISDGEFVIVRGEVTVNSGSLQGAGVLVSVQDATGAYAGQNFYIDFLTDPDASGIAVEDHPDFTIPGKTYRFEKKFRINAPTASRFFVAPMNHWSGFGHTLQHTNDLTWHECSVSPPTAADASVGIITGAIVGPGGPAAFLEQVVAASGSTPAKYQMLAGQDGSRIGLVADVISLGNDVDGIIEDVLVVENGKARISAALIRELQVPPTPTSEIFHDVMLKPRIYIGGDGDTIQYQGGASYGANPARIDPDLSGLPALAEGESYDVKAVSITPTQFTARAKKISTPVDVTQQSNAGTNKGSGVDPRWQTNKPTTDNAHDGYYEFTFSGTLPKTSQQGPDGGYYYRGSVILKGRTSAGWQVLENVQLTRYIAGGLGSYPASINFSQTEMVQSSADLGSGADRFGVQPSTGTTITAFTKVRYVTRTSASTTAITNDIRWTVYPPGNG